MDDLTKIKGIGDALAKKLSGAGVSSFQELADMSDSRVELLDAELNLKGRVDRFEYREQAAALIDSEPESVKAAPKLVNGKICEARVTLYQGSTPKTFSVGDEIPSGYADSPENHPHEER